MYCKRAPLVAVFLALCGACNKQPAPPAVTRIAVLRFEDLSYDPSAPWMGRAFSEIITHELAAVPKLYAISSAQMHSLDREAGVRPISAPGISSERELALISGANRLAYGTYSVRGGRLYAQLTIEDPVTLRTVQVLHAEADAKDIDGAATSLAHQVAPAAGAFGTTNTAAIEAYISGLENPNASGEFAARAIAADPNFGPPYRMLAAAKARQKDVEGALSVLAAAEKRGNAIPATERARILVEEAGLRNFPAGRRQALAALVKESPGDLEAWRTLAELSYAARDYRQAIAALERVLDVQPDSADALNQLGYANAYSGNQAAALSALRRYQALRPADPNALDSIGDAYLISGNLSEAEKLYLQAQQKDPHFQGGGELYKAAMARLMAGDIPGADALEKQLDDSRSAAHDPAVPYRQAEWAWISGRRKPACQQLLTFAQQSENGPLKELASAAYSELALWNIMLGDRDAANEMVRKAVQFAGPKTATPAMLVRFLSQPPASAAEWSSRADQLFRNQSPSPLKDLWLAYAFLLNKEFPDAAAALQRWSAGETGGDESQPVLQAWALVETGKESPAADLLRFNPTPPVTGPGLFTSFYFPRIYYLRGVVADRQGKHEEARTAYQLFLKLSGPTPLIWGEEQKAQNAAPRN